MSCKCAYPFPMQSCGQGYPSPSGPVVCRPHYPAVRENFVTPEADSEVVINLTATQALTVGQGILIGGTFYQVTDIIDSLNIKAKHNGVGADPGFKVIAEHPVYGCYQYPVLLAGKVMLPKVPSLAGLETDEETAISSSVSSPTTQEMLFGYAGPTTIDFHAEVEATLASTPAWVAIALPVARRTDAPRAAFSAYLDDGAGPVPAVAKFGAGDYADYVIVGKGGGNLFGNGTKIVVVSGSYEIQL